MSRFRLAAAVAALIAAFAAAATQSPAASSCANAEVTPTAKNQAKAADALLCLIQAARAERGLKKLTTSRALGSAAGRFAAQMADRRFFSHTGPGGSTPCSRVKAAGYKNAARVDEALGWGLRSSATPKELLKTLTSDAQHRAIIFSAKLKDIGVGLAPEVPVKGEHEPGATAVVDIARKGAPGVRCR